MEDLTKGWYYNQYATEVELQKSSRLTWNTDAAHRQQAEALHCRAVGMMTPSHYMAVDQHTRIPVLSQALPLRVHSHHDRVWIHRQSQRSLRWADQQG